MPGRDGYQVWLLGVPGITLDGNCVDFPTRKSACLCFFLAANAGRHVERRRLSGLLWAESEPELARTSLRKALSLLTASKHTAPLIGKDRASVWFAGDPARCDLSLFNRCLAIGTERAYRKALELWRGEPLQGLEVGEPTFDDWVAEFRADTIGLTHRLLSSRLQSLPARSADRGLVLALCELIVRIEPTDTDANERLIHLLAEQGDTAAATRRYRAYAQALAELDLPLPDELRSFVESLGPSRPHGPRPAPTAPIVDRPTVAVVRANAAMGRPTPDLFSFAHSELLFQLARFRSMRCFDRDATPGADQDAGLIRRIRLGEAEDHDYRLLLWDEPAARAVYLRCLNARRQDTVSCVRIDYESLRDRAEAEKRIAAAINSLEQDILNDERPSEHSVFGRWLEAYKLLAQYTEASNRAALANLEALLQDERGNRLSLVHSSISSLLMIRRLLVPAEAETAEKSLERARGCAQRALSLDDLEPFNHVILGWLRLQAHEHDRGLAAFDDALELNPSSSRTLIAAAEANAYSGRFDRARTLADRAVALTGRYMPPYFHFYLANINYMAGHLEAAADHLERAPENVHWAMLSAAVADERGDARGAATARVRFDQEIRRTRPHAQLSGGDISRWIVSSSMIRQDYARRRLFGALERAGLPISQAG
jgi:DNA-binding SARP family transcriptional activator/tetratricopeptide (TPR) repeat protein